MRVAWDQVDIGQYGALVVRLAQLHFGADLREDPASLGEGTRVLSAPHGTQTLALWTTPRPPSREEQRQFQDVLAEVGIRWGLVVVRQGGEFVPPHKEHRDPRVSIAQWGHMQVDALASMNGGSLSETVPTIAEPNAGGIQPTARPSGALVWSDIAEFVQLGVDIGRKIGQDPAQVRVDLVNSVAACFQPTASTPPTISGMAGGDGWFHFWEGATRDQVVPFTVGAHHAVLVLSQGLFTRVREHLVVAMGIHVIDRLYLTPGGPVDDDSITAYRLTGKKYHQYDVRATDELIRNLIPPVSRKYWTLYSDVAHPDGRQLDVYGQN